MKDAFLFDLINPEPALPFAGRTSATRATSHAAAQDAKPSVAQVREQVYQAIRKAGFGLTDEEGITRTGLNPNTYRPRRIELVDAGRVRASGVTRKTLSGRQAVVWEVV